MPRSLLIPALSLSVVLWATPAQAQKGAVEFGVDLGVTYSDFEESDVSLTELGIPAQRLRVGAFATDLMSFETSFGFSLLHAGDVTTTSTNIGMAVNIHSSPNPLDVRVYVAPTGGVGVFHISDETTTQWAVGAVLGIKAPVRDNFLVRVEAGYSHGFENSDVGGVNHFSGIGGLSFLVR